MQFPFRRARPAAWATRLPQLERNAEGAPRAAERPAPPEPGGLTLHLTRPAPARVTVRDVVADPVAAEQLPPPVLVSTLLECEAENRALRRRLHARRQQLQELKQGMVDHVVEDAELRGRLRTLEEVIAALHANIEDLRIQRDQLLAR